MSNTPEKKGVSAVDFFCIGFGAIVGVGWAVAINGWMTSCGGPIPAAIGYIVALVMMVPIALCYCELVPMLPVAGGGMAFAYKAFAAQSIAVGEALGFDKDKLNVNGGAIALGHPVGASGARILVTLLYAMKHRGAHKGLATLCIGGGMGCATIVEMD